MDREASFTYLLSSPSSENSLSSELPSLECTTTKPLLSKAIIGSPVAASLWWQRTANCSAVNPCSSALTELSGAMLHPIVSDEHLSETSSPTFYRTWTTTSC